MSRWPHPPSPRDARGTALLVTVLFLLVVTTLASGLLTFLNNSVDYFADNSREIERRYIAEGGVEKALAELRTKGAAYTGEAATSLGDGTFSIEVRRSASFDGYEIASTASLADRGTEETRILVEAVPEPDGAFRAVRWVEVTRR